MTNPPPDNNLARTLFHVGAAVLAWLGDAAAWTGPHLPLLLACATPPAVAAAVLHHHLAHRALTQRQRFILTPTRRFDPSTEDIWRQTALLLRAAGKGPWWAPRATKRVRIRLRADGTVPLEYSVEAHTDAATLLADSRFQEVSVAQASAAEDPVAAQAEQDRRDKKDKELKKRKIQEKAQRKKAGDGTEEKESGRLHAVRAEFVLRGRPSEALREVPLEPDPLQPLIDAVRDVQTELGELAEVVLDIRSIPTWQLKLRRWQLLHEAREKGRADARTAARHAAADAAEAQDSLRYQLLTLLDPSAKAPTSLMPAPRPRPVDTRKALGRLGTASGLVRIQLLVRCTSTLEGRARQHLDRLTAALDVFAEGNRLSLDGGRFLKWTWGADSFHRRAAFDRRWTTGQVAPRAQNWLNIAELQGLLKPPTMHSELPVLASELPTYEPGEALVPHGYLVSADGRSRLIATKEDEFLFSVSVGKSNYGKTEKALVRALALAFAGAGVLFVDPHGDSWKTAAPYLAHPLLARRVWRIDLARAEEAGAVLPCWNPLGMEGGKSANKVAAAAVDALATALSWTDAAAPRAITILTKACEALVAHNQRAVAAGRPEFQATLHQIRTLLTNKAWRDDLLQHLSGEQRQWWETTYAGYQVAEVLGPVTNPLDRLAANDVTRAFLGSPRGAYDIRDAMDKGKIVWLCLEGVGPSDRLLVSMIMQDLLRAGLSRRDLDEDARRPFHIFADELISLDPAGGPTFAAITEQLRKFKGRLHVMVQLLNRVSATTRESILQNSSVVSTTAGSMAAVRAVADEWHGAVAPARIAELPRFHHYVQVTADGNRVGPLLVKGPQVSEVFRRYLSDDLVKGLVAAADRATGSKDLRTLLGQANGQDAKVRQFTSVKKDQEQPSDTAADQDVADRKAAHSREASRQGTSEPTSGAAGDSRGNGAGAGTAMGGTKPARSRRGRPRRA